MAVWDTVWDTVAKVSSVVTIVGFAFQLSVSLNDAFKGGVQKAVEALGEKFGGLGTTVRGLESTVGGLGTTAGGLETTVGGLRMTVGVLGRRVGGLGRRVECLGRRIGGLGTTVDALAGGLQALSQQLGYLQDTVGEREYHSTETPRGAIAETGPPKSHKPEAGTQHEPHNEQPLQGALAGPSRSGRSRTTQDTGEPRQKNVGGAAGYDSSEDDSRRPTILDRTGAIETQVHRISERLEGLEERQKVIFTLSLSKLSNIEATVANGMAKVREIVKQANHAPKASDIETIPTDKGGTSSLIDEVGDNRDQETLERRPETAPEDKGREGDAIDD